MYDMDLRKLEEKIKSGKGTTKDLHDLATESGKQFANDVIRQLKEQYPNGNVTEAEVREIVSPLLKEKYAYVAEWGTYVSNVMYRQAGLGLKAIAPEYNALREDDLVKAIVERSATDE